MKKHQSNNLIITINNIKYVIKEKKKSASVIGTDSASGKIFIPQSIKYESQEYAVTKILECAFEYSSNISSIEFPNNSKLRKIKHDAFLHSSIESITIPSSLEILEDKWCRFAEDLTNIRIMPNNKNYIYLDNKYIIGKSNQEDEVFDLLIFARRDIEKATIPSFIKIIKPFAFHSCERLNEIEILEDSNLISIDEFGFSNTKIESIKIPPNLICICEAAFSYCSYLKHINIPINSDLRIIESFAFGETNLEEFTIPSKLTYFEDGWCFGISVLDDIKVSPDNPIYTMYDNKFVIGKSSPEKNDFDVLVLAVRDIKIAEIPSFIEIIGANAFELCRRLQKVEFQNESKIKIIKKYAFSESSIREIVIPKSVTKICEEAFSECEFLRKVEIHKNSELVEIEESAFAIASIESFFFSSKLIKIGPGAFSGCSKFQIIEIDENSQLKFIDEFSFRGSEHLIIMAPNPLKILYD